ncbi:MAG: hypothetical protein ABSC16_07355 [Candidatus Dormibacteria bacterium]|jgi:hypothetical protein|nr:hypothetical protein [Chloroflexota bacterium]
MSEEVPTSGDPGTPSAWGDDTWPGVSEGSWAEASGDPVGLAPAGRVIGLRRGVAIVAAVGGLVLGSAVGGFLISRAATGTPVAAATTASGSNPTASPSPGPHSRGGFGGPSAFFGVNLIEDAATAIGVSEQTLESDLQSGKTVAQVATANGKTAQDVITALVGDETTAIDGLVSSGKLTASQASKLTANLTQMVTDFVDQTRPATVPGIGGGGAGEMAALQAAATTIGVTASALASDLAAGQSIAEVAGAHDVSVSKVVAAVTTAVDSQISSLESSGRITSAEASTLTSEVQSRVTAWVDGTYPGWPFGPFGTFGTASGGSFGGGPFAGMPWGHGPAVSPSASPSGSVS